MIHPIHYAILENSELKFENKARFQKYLASIAYKNKPTKIEVIVKRYRKKRSVKQNAYYWLCLTFIAKEIGEDDPEELHDTFKAMFLTDRRGKFPIVRSTTKLTTLEFMEYMEKIARKMAELNISLPNPDDIYLEDN